MNGHLTAVVAPGVPVDAAACRAALDRALAAWDASGRLVVTGSRGELRAAVAAAGGDGEVVVLPGPGVDVDALDLPGTAAVLRVDLTDRHRDPSPRVRRHLRGRGVEGIRYAVDAWAVHRRAPAVRHAYGPDPDQHADLRLPSGPAGRAGHPVAVLVHGGYWRSRWESDLMEPTALDLTARGLATWNVEYRRPDDHDWAATTGDVAAALAALAGVDAPLDVDRVVTLGHSAGGQLVTRLAADVAADPAARVRPALTVSLAGVLDLVEADRRGMGGGAVADALGGHAGDLPEQYRASSPLERLPVGLPLAVVCGTGDDPDLLDLSRAFGRAATAAGDDVAVVEAPGDHFAVIDPRSAIWAQVVDVVTSRVGHGRG